MIIRKKLSRDDLALSVMYDAIFFIVLVSISGVILLPAMQSNTVIRSSVEKHREELVDETLLMLMTSRDDFFYYTFAGSQIESIIGEFYDDWLINTTVQALLGKQMQHKTYADICAESLISQFKVFGARINIFTEQYDIYLKKRITSVIRNHTGGRYGFNLSLTWRPIEGLPIGGDLFIGDKPPEKNIYVAKSYITLPQTRLSDWLNQAEDYVSIIIENDTILRNISSYLTNFSELNQSIVSENLTRVINSTFYDILFDGVNTTIGEKRIVFPGVISIVVDFVFDKIQASVKSIFNDALGGVSDLLGDASEHVNVTGVIDEILVDAAVPVIQQFIPGFSGDDVDNLDELFLELKNAVVGLAKNMVNDFLKPYIDTFVGMVMGLVGSYIDSIGELSSEVLDFFNQRVNLLRAEIRLVIWEEVG